MSIDLSRYVRDLAVAQRQIVAICRALTQTAKLVIMDEPTTSLTNHEITRLFRIIEELKEQKISLIFVSHKLDEVLEVSERICILRDGVNVVDGATKDFDHSTITFHMTGRWIEKAVSKPPIEQHDLVFSAKNCSGNGQLRNINLELYKGEVLGITGLLGSGRTELAESIFGLHPFRSGSMQLMGKYLRVSKPSDAIRDGIGYVPEDRLTQGLYLDVEIYRNISSAIIDQNTTRFGLLAKSHLKTIVKKNVDAFRIKTDDIRNPVKSLSGGNQQRVVLAKWLATNPKLLILNCPTVGVDVGSKDEIHEMILAFSSLGIGIIVISDDLAEIMRLCNRVLVMRKGKIVNNISVDGLTEQTLKMAIADA